MKGAQQQQQNTRCWRNGTLHMWGNQTRSMFWFRPSGSLQQEGYGIFKYKLGVLGNMQWVIGVNLMQLGKALLFLLHFALQIFNYNKVRNHLL